MQGCVSVRVLAVDSSGVLQKETEDGLMAPGGCPMQWVEVLPCLLVSICIRLGGSGSVSSGTTINNTFGAKLNLDIRSTV